MHRPLQEYSNTAAPPTRQQLHVLIGKHVRQWIEFANTSFQVAGIAAGWW